MISKLYKYTLLLFTLILFFCCSSESNSYQKNNDDSIIDNVQNFFNDTSPKNFIVELEFKVFKRDNFELFYIDSDSANRFSEKKKISKKVSQSKNFSKVSFELPKGHYPNKIRLDFGSNRNQKKIVINKISISNTKNEIIIEKELISFFFVINNFLTYDPNKGEFQTKSVNNRYDPFIISSPLLIQKIKLEL